MSDRNGGGLLTFILGGLVGAVIGVLYAPRSGTETREILRERAQECLKECNEALDEQKVKFKDVYETGKKTVTERAEDVKSKIEQAKETIQQKISTVKDKTEETKEKKKGSGEGKEIKTSDN